MVRSGWGLRPSKAGQARLCGVGCSMDKAAIFAEVLRRNALRREAQLPALDVAAEYEHAVAVAAWAEFREVCDKHDDLYEEIKEAVLQEGQEKYNNPHYGKCFGSRLFVHHETMKRFYAALKLRGYKRPPFPARNLASYGQSKERQG